MNDLGTPDDQMLDRLVDDELNEQQRRELFASLENQPGGWRRCAMAFLQQQAWRRAMYGLTGGLPPGSGLMCASAAELVQVVPVDAGPRRRELSRPVPWYAPAAGLLIAFGLARPRNSGCRLSLLNGSHRSRPAGHSPVRPADRSRPAGTAEHPRRPWQPPARRRRWATGRTSPARRCSGLAQPPAGGAAARRSPGPPAARVCAVQLG